MKYINGDGFKSFRKYFLAEFKKGFVVSANTFDNVQGNFPIGFLIWDLEKKDELNKIVTKAYDDESIFIKDKVFYVDENNLRITDWISKHNLKNKKEVIGYTGNNGPDFQNNNYCLISSVHKINSNGTPNNATKYFITKENLLQMAIYFAVRHCIEATWLNDRDQFLYPREGWQADTEFQNDCLAFTLFHGQNRITSKEEINHWIPFTEQQINAREKFESSFMTDFIKGKLKTTTNADLFTAHSERKTPLVFSETATEVFEAGLALWKYYHAQPKCNVNASLYDIREYFQGRNDKGKMNNKSNDEVYMKLIGLLREKIKLLADKIAPKVYAYEFLKE